MLLPPASYREPMSAEPIRWDVPGPYTVAFSTRAGGVSDGPYASLNLGVLTDDAPAAVAENRCRLCATVGADPTRATMARQQHGATVLCAEPRGIVTPGATGYPECDGLWSDVPGQAMLLLTADCLPIAIARTSWDGGSPRHPALVLLHAGWRGLLAGIVEEGVRALRTAPGADLGARNYGSIARTPLRAAIGPAIGPCCYEVGDDVAGRFRSAYGTGVLHGRRLDLPAVAEAALRAAGVAEVDRLDRCTACAPELFFSHRRDAGLTGRQGVIGLVG